MSCILYYEITLFDIYIKQQAFDTKTQATFNTNYCKLLSKATVSHDVISNKLHKRFRNRSNIMENCDYNLYLL